MGTLKKKDKKKFDKEILRCEQAIRLDPNNYDKYLDLYSVYGTRGKLYKELDPNKAKEDYLLALENALIAYDLNPKNHVTLYALGSAHRLNGYPKKAIPLYLESLTINPKEIKVNYLLAEAYYQDENYEKAIEFYQNFIKFNDPGYRGAISEAIKKIDDIASILNKTIFPVPIDFSPLRKILPLGEDIVYSTFARAQHLASIRNVRGVKVKTTSTTWYPHILITKKGFAYIDSPPLMKYTDWFRWKAMSTLNIKRAGKIGSDGLNFWFGIDNTSMPLIRAFITERKKLLESKIPIRKLRKKFVLDRVKTLAN